MQRALFDKLTLRGDSGALTFGHATAARLTSWTIYRYGPQQWKLIATFGFVDKGLITRRPLLFSGKRQGLKGLWCFPLIDLQIGDTQMRAQLGPPEH